MKKFFKSLKWKRYLKARIKYEHKKNVKSKIKFKHRNIISNRVIDLVAPKNFSLLENIDEVLDYFSLIEDQSKTYKKIRINIKDIESISSETILYLLSFIRNLIYKYPNLNVKGNLPKSPNIKQFIISCGFHNYVNGIKLPKKLPTEYEVLTIRNGSDVNSLIAEEVINFARNKLNRTRDKFSKTIYETILECMGNTVEHAYNSKREQKSDWWIIAFFNNGRIEFCILDNGFGIPKTVRKNFSEKMKSILFPDDDYFLIESAMTGSFRTRTGNYWRGNGLPSIHKHVKENLISDLIIISGRAYYNTQYKDKRNLNKNFNGTLFRWSFS
jgi:hypothetical protein